MNSADPVLRPYLPGEFEHWQALWQLYIEDHPMPPEQQAMTWSRMVDPQFNLHGLAAVRGSEWQGFAQFYLHPSTWDLAPICYLQDLYVHPGARRQGLARRLIDAVWQAAAARGAAHMHWQTQGDNAAAQRLYDTFAERSGYVKYVWKPAAR